MAENLTTDMQAHSDFGTIGEPAQVRSASGTLVRLLVFAGLTLGFVMAPTLQGISLVADPGSRTDPSIRTADTLASSEVERLVSSR